MRTYTSWYTNNTYTPNIFLYHIRLYKYNIISSVVLVNYNYN